MAKGGSAKMLYFVLYIVLITELLIVITERDELQENEKLIQEKLIGSIATSYRLPFTLNVSPKVTDFNLGAADRHESEVVFELGGLVSDSEKAGVVYTVKLAPGSRSLEGFASEGVNSVDNTSGTFRIERTNGSAKFLGSFRSEGDYKFIVSAKTKRVLPNYLTPQLLEILKRDIGDNAEKEVQSNDGKPETFSIIVKKQGGVKKSGASIIDG